jgi:hypothetical protein
MHTDTEKQRQRAIERKKKRQEMNQYKAHVLRDSDVRLFSGGRSGVSSLS